MDASRTSEAEVIEWPVIDGEVQVEGDEDVVLDELR